MSHSPSGLFASLRSLLANGLELARVRLELLVVELEEEKSRLLRLLAFGALAFLLLGSGIVFFAMFLTVLFWEEHRLLVLGLLTLMFFLAGLGALGLAWRAARSRSGLLAATLGELAQDQAALAASEQADQRARAEAAP